MEQEPCNQKIDKAYAAYIAQQNNNRIEANAKSLLIVALGSLIMAINMKTFINQGGLLPGGANGVVVLTQRIFEHFLHMEIPFSPLSFLVNAIPAYLAFKTVGKKFTLFSCLCIVMMSLMTDIIPAHAVTYDPLLISIFGGIINGSAISLILNAGASSGGTDFVAMYFSVRKGISTWNYVLAFNATIILKTVFIITDKPQDIADKIMEMTHHSATMFKAEGAYTHKPHYVVYSILSAEEVQNVRRFVRSIDAHAFINVMNSESVTGNFYMRPIL